MKYPVRCCCEPQKILGYIDLPRDRYGDGERTRVKTMPMLSVTAFPKSGEKPVAMRSTDEIIILRRYRDYAVGIDEMAVYSDDRPIEFWRKIVGFMELKPADFTFHTIDPSIVTECGEALGKDRVVTLDVEGSIADRCVSGRVKAIKFDSRNLWHDITIEEMVPI